MCYKLAGGCQWHEAKSFLGPAGVWPNMFGGRNKVVVAASSHRRSAGSITQKSQIRAAKQTPIWRYATISQETKLINFDIGNPL